MVYTYRRAFPGLRTRKTSASFGRQPINLSRSRGRLVSGRVRARDSRGFFLLALPCREPAHKVGPRKAIIEVTTFSRY